MGAKYRKRQGAVIGGKTPAAQAANLTRYYFPFGGPATILEVTESMYISFPSHITGLYIRSTGPAGAGETIVVTVRLNEASTPLVQTITGAAPTAAGPDLDVVQLVPGDRITVQNVTSLNANAEEVNWSMEIFR